MFGHYTRHPPAWLIAAASLALGCGEEASVESPTGDRELALLTTTAVAVPDTYVLEIVASAANGIDMNGPGDIVGTSYQDPGCGPFCLPTQDTVVWSGPDRIVLPALSGFTGIYPGAMDDAAAVVGLAGLPGADTAAVRWEPSGTTYTVTDLGVLPGADLAYAAGMDETGRVVGWSNSTFFPPAVASPFLWTEAGGMVDLGAQGFPVELPLDVSPAGMVASTGSWYDLDDPASAAVLTAPPRGYLVSSYPSAINDAGEQARFLVSTGSENLVYAWRYHPDGTWQQIGFAGTGHLTTYGIGSINSAGTVTATQLGDGMVAWGPDGALESLDPYIADPYVGADVVWAGPINESNEILAEIVLGAATRLVKLVPAEACVGDCLRVNTLTLKTKFVQSKRNPGQCTETGKMHNNFRATVTVTDDAGTPLSGAAVTGRWMDSYWMDDTSTLVTDSLGVAVFSGSGPCGTGTILFVVDDVSLSGWTFDKTVGTLAASQIPK
jgi:hypothetical protein